MPSYITEKLKSIKIEIKRPNIQSPTASSDIDYGFANEDDVLIIKRRDNEGAKPLFGDLNVEEHAEYSHNMPSTLKDIEKFLRRSPCSETVRSVLKRNDNENKLHDSHESRSPMKTKDVMKKLENILGDIKHKDKSRSPSFKHARKSVESDLKEKSRKRQRSESSKFRSRRSYSSDSSSDRTRKSCRYSRSPIPKRKKNDSPHKYGHSSKYDSDDSINSKRSTHRHRRRSYSRSPSHTSTSRRRKSSYNRSSSPKSKYDFIDKKMRRELSAALSDGFSSIMSDKMHNPWKGKNKDKHYQGKSKHKKSSGKHSSYKGYEAEAMTKDIEERYYRYYAVMYAFTIILDIMRQDGIYSI